MTLLRAGTWPARRAALAERCLAAGDPGRSATC